MEVMVAPEPAAAGAFGERVLNDASAAMVAILAALGDRLGLFKDLLTRGSATTTEFAARNGIGWRYAREWLAAMASAGYVLYDPARERFELPPEHAPALARENGPLFLGGVLQMLPPLAAVFLKVEMPREERRPHPDALPEGKGEAPRSQITNHKSQIPS